MPERVLVGPRFELFLALAAVLGSEVGTGETALWLAQARRKLDQAARRRMGDLAAVPAIWPVMASVLEAAALESETEDVIAAFAALPAAVFAQRCRTALPPSDARFAPLLRALAGDAAALQQAAADALRRFDRVAFAALWRRVRPDLETAARQAAASGATTTEAIAFPSLFGAHRFRFGAVVVETRPLESLAAPAQAAAVAMAPAGTDPALVFRALGDATRYAIARLIAHEALTGAELARRLGVSGPTLTHHLRILRQARLVSEEKNGNRIRLRLDRRAIDALSAAAAADLFGDRPLALRRSRTRNSQRG